MKSSLILFVLLFIVVRKRILSPIPSDKHLIILHCDSCSKLVSAICSLFTDAYVKNWKEFLPQKKLQKAPRFDGRAVCYKSYKLIRDYLSWRQADCQYILPLLSFTTYF